MRPVFIALIAMLAVLGVGAAPAGAQFNNRFCSEGGGPDTSGDRDCSFATMQQCREAARGIAKTCSENFSWQGRRDGGQNRNSSRGRSRRRGD